MYLTRLYPIPERYSTSDGAFYFGNEITLRVPKTLPDVICKNLIYLWERFTFGGSKLNVFPDNVDGLILGGGGNTPENGYYGISVTEKGATVGAGSDKAFVDGFTTLLQLLIPENLTEGSESFYIPCTEIRDNPSLGLRMMHICVFPESKMSTLEKAISLAGFLKFTHVILEFWGTFKYKAHPMMSWENSYTAAQLRPLVELANGYGMEVIPMINHFGHAAQARGRFGRHVTLDRDPRMQLLFEPDGWTWCLSNPDSIKLLDEMRAELSELCGKGSYFHLGFDEAYSFATCPKCRKRVPHELLAEYINSLTEKLAKDGRRPIIWHDELIDRNDYPADLPYYLEANGQHHNTSPAIDLIDKRVIIADWQYQIKTPDIPETDDFLRRGFDVLLCPWDDPANVAGLSEAARNKGCAGVLLTTWDHLPNCILPLPGFADSIWSGDTTPPQRIEIGALMRKIRRANGFADAGWSKFESSLD